MRCRKLLSGKYLFVPVVVAIFIACSEDDPIPIDQDRNGPNAELFTFLDSFEAEAIARGVDLPLDNFQLTFVDSIEGFCGYGWWDYNGTGTRRVEISNECWPFYTESQKENLIYHEFGHALLSLGHDDISFDGGYPKSLMCGQCDQTTIYYHPNMKEFYLDELFAPNSSPRPDWASPSELIRPVFFEDFESSDPDWILFINNDDTNISDWGSTYIGEKGENRSLQVTSADVPLTGSSLLALKRFEIAGFEDCSSLKATAKVRFSHTMNGTITMGLSLRERLLTGDLLRFMYHGKEEIVTSADVEREYSMSIYCLPEKSDVVTISFIIESQSRVDLSIDDVVVELWQ